MTTRTRRDPRLPEPAAAPALASAKSKGLDPGYRHRLGLMRVVMDRGRFGESH